MRAGATIFVACGVMRLFALWGVGVVLAWGRACPMSEVATPQTLGGPDMGELPFLLWI